MLDIPTFRTLFPEFADPTLYSDTVIGFYLTLAQSSLNPTVWGSRYNAACGFYTAHYVALAALRAATLARAALAPGGATVAAPGLATGLVSSKSISGVSVSYDLSIGQTEGAGAYNLTQYGQAYSTLLESVSVGAVQF